MPAENPFLCEPTWADISSTVLPGGYEIGSIVEAEAQKAKFRVRVLGDWSANAFAQFFCAPGTEGQEQIALWAAAKELQHPNVSSPLAEGALAQGDAQLIYFIGSEADENLASVLRERPVTAEEAHEMLTSLRHALEYLHAQGWVHGHLSPEQVLAMGDSIRISTAYAAHTNVAPPMNLTAPKYVAPETSNGNITSASDVWCLGATLFEALTQEVFSPARLKDVDALPEPFNRLVARCVDPDPQTRCVVAEIGSLALSHPAALRVKEPVHSPTPAKQDRLPLVTRAPLAEKQSGPAYKLWIYVAAAALLVVLVLWAAWPKHQYSASPTQVATTKAANTNAAAPVPKTTSWETKTLAPAKSTPARNNIPVPPPVDKFETQGPATINGPVWRVVVFTYARQQDAENKVHLVNRQHPNLNAAVFDPSEKGSFYLVTVGGKMNREQAAQLRRRAIGLGLPRDSYIQNYRQ